MKHTTSTLLFLILLSLTHFIHGDMDLIQKTCKNTKHYNLCITSLKSNKTSSTTNTKGLALIMLGIGVSNSTSTSIYLSSQLLNSNLNDPTLKKVLKECADKYGFAAESLQSAADDLGNEEFDYARMHVMAAADYANGCHNAFRRYNGLVYPSEIAKREDGLKRICDVVMGILDQLGF